MEGTSQHAQVLLAESFVRLMALASWPLHLLSQYQRMFHVPCVCFSDTCSLSCPGWPFVHYVAQDSLKLVIIPSQSAKWLGLQTMPPCLARRSHISEEPGPFEGVPLNELLE